MKLNKKTTVTISQEELDFIKYIYDTIRMEMEVSDEEVGTVLHKMINRIPSHTNIFDTLIEFKYSEGE